MNEQIAAVVEQTAKFSESDSLDTPDVRGLFSADCSYSYFYDGPLLRGFCSSGASIGQFNFAKLPSLRVASDGTTDTAPSILCVCPFNQVNVLVGLEDALGNGLLYLVNVGFGKVLRGFTVPFGVTSIETIHGDSICDGLPYLGDELRSFSGVIACGTKTGQIYIIDMVLDNPVESTLPLQLHKVDINGEATIPDRRQLLANHQKALCYSLACTDDPDSFRYMSAGCQLLHEANHDDVYISSLKFLPQLGSLCVGYSFGSFQLWRLDVLSLDYSSPFDPRSLPVSHFNFLEPENDPRSFCYLWVAKCSGVASATALSDSMQEYVAGSVANAALYQLAYEEKTYTDGGAPLFKDLMQVGCALQHHLAPAEDVVTSWVVSCDSLTNIRSLRSLEDDSQLDTLGADTYLTMISWRVRYTDNSISSHFALFDINRWYHAQMPKQIRWYDGWCSYFSQYTFDEAVGDMICVDLYIDSSTISCYKCPRLRKLERFQYPSSLRFEVKVLLPGSIRSVQYNGVQKQSLFDVLESSVESIVDPANAFQLLRSAYLIPNNSTDVMSQRKAILTTLLLHTHVEYIVKCFDVFSMSDNAPVSVDFLMDWIWDRLERVIHQFDNNCISLYDWSGSGVDASVRQSLLSAITQTKNIIIVLKHACVLEKRLPKLKLGAPEERLAVAEARLLHMKLVWWCLNRGLLPETGEGLKTAAHSFSYPGTTLKRSYNSRHSELLVSSSNSTSELMIDVLAKKLGPQLNTVIEQEGGSGVYPPPNIKALLDIFLLEGDLSHKLEYFVYTMLDLMALVDTSVNESLSSHTLSLLSNIEPGRNNSNLSSLVLTLWSLDHREYEDVIVTLRQPGVGAHLTSELIHLVLLRLLRQGEGKTALSMTSLVSTCSSHSVSDDLLISIYLANSMLSAAVDISRRSHPSLITFTKILTSLTSNEISDLLCLRLTQPEFDCLSKHLEEKGDLDKLVVHHLQMGNLSEAVTLNKALNTQPLWKGDLKAKERAMTRDRLVKWQLSLLPPIQKKLLEDPTCLQLPPRWKTTHLKSLQRSFIFGSREPKVLEPMDIAQMVLQSSTSIRHKPFIHNLTSSVKKPSRSVAPSALREKSITGLFDSPSLGNRSLSKRRAEYSDVVPAKRSASDDSLISWNNVKQLLQTPLVNRKSPTYRQQASAPTMTPHSILKMRKPQIKSSPRGLSGRLSTTPKSGSSNAVGLMETVSRSSARVKFNVEEEEECEYLPPKTIDFNEEDDSITEYQSRESVDTPVSERAEESEEASEILFNMSAPLTQVITGASALVQPMNDELFTSALSDLSPLDVDNSQEPLAVSAQDYSDLTQTHHHSPTQHKSSPNESLDDSLKSLSNLDTEAQMCGLELRQVREAVMNQDKAFSFSSVFRVASPDVEVRQATTDGFTFTPPNVVHGERRRTRSMGTPSVTIEHRPIPKPTVVESRTPVEQFTEIERGVVKPSVTVEHRAVDAHPVSVQHRTVTEQIVVEPLVRAEGRKSIAVKPVVSEECWIVEKTSDETIVHSKTPKKQSASSTVKTVVHENVVRVETSVQRHAELKEGSQDFAFSPVTHVAPADAVTDQHSVQTEFTFTTPNVVRTERRVTRSMRKSSRPVTVESTPVQPLVVSQSKPAKKRVEKTKPAEEPVKEIKLAEEPVEEIKLAEEPVEEIKLAEEPVEKIKPAEEPVEKIKLAEEPVEEIKLAEEPVEEIKLAEEPVEEIKLAEEPVEEIKPAEPVEEIKPAEEPIEDTTPAVEPVGETKENDDAEVVVNIAVDENETVEVAVKEKIKLPNHQEYAFSPVTQIAHPSAVDTGIAVTNEFTFAPPSSATRRKTSRSKSAVTVEEATAEVSSRRTSGRRKSVRPVKIKLPEEQKPESVSARVLRTRASVGKQKPVKPVVITLPASVYRKDAAAASPDEEEAATDSAVKPLATRSRTRQESESSVESAPATPRRGRGRPRKDSMKKTQLLAAVPETDRLNLEVAKDLQIASTSKPSPSRQGRSKTTPTSSESRDKQANAKKVSSTKKHQKASPEVRKSTRARSSVKKPDLSPILPQGGESSSAGPQTRARRKL